jgi:hypothetical protein
VDASAVDAAREQPVAQVFEHRLRAAEEPLVDVLGRQGIVEEELELRSVDAPVEEVDLVRLAREHVVQNQPLQVAVLEVGELVQEHDRAGRAVAV